MNIDSTRLVRALCPNCSHQKHVLKNGRVWAFCRMNQLIGTEFTEDEVREMILASREPRERRSPATPR